MDGDSAPFAVSPNSWVNAENIRVGSTDKGAVGGVESVGSTLKLDTDRPGYVRLGSAEDVDRRRLLYFLCDTGEDREDLILCYDEGAGEIYTVLKSSQVRGGLSFSKDHPIHSARVVDGRLYWVNGAISEPRRVNIEAGIKLNHPAFTTDEIPYATPLDPYDITLVCPPPAYPPALDKWEDAGYPHNFIERESRQFAWQYVYYTGEQSVLSMLSEASLLNYEGDPYNAIRCTLSASETIPGTVRALRLLARAQSDNVFFVIKTWDKEVDGSALAAHNAGNPLTHDYYGDLTGEALDKATANKPFDAVPLYADTLERAGGRLHLAGNTEGYDAPRATSMVLFPRAYELGSEGGVTVSKNVFKYQALYYNIGDLSHSFGYAAWMVHLTELPASGVGYYEYVPSKNLSLVATDWVEPLGAVPTTISQAQLLYRGATWQEVRAAITPAGSPLTATVQETATATYATVALSGEVDATVFKSGAQYRAGMAFYDRALRKCGVVTDDSLLVSIPKRTYEGTTGVPAIEWRLTNGVDMSGEIPEWAHYYAPLRSLCQKTRFFIQSYAHEVRYAKRDADGVYDYTDTAFSAATVALALDTSALQQSKLGYAFQEGDVCELIDSTSVLHRLSVLGQDGKYILIKPKDLGSLTAKTFIYEIYSPYARSGEEPFYEVGQLFPVVDPGQATRRYSATVGSFRGDTFVLSRMHTPAPYNAEAMCPNDDDYKRWDSDAGRINYPTLLGQAKNNNVRWSNVYRAGTAQNGLSSFDALDFKTLPQEMGPVRKLQLTSKVGAEQGVVMLAISEEETASLYLGEAQLIGSTGAAQVMASAEVVGTINVLKGNFGTLNPESVCEYRGLVFFYDARSAKFVQYSANGLFPISNYRMTRFFKEFTRQYQGMTSGEISDLGSRPFVLTQVDPAHEELLVTLPTLLATPPKGYLPDYPETVYPFDVWDGRGKTLVFRLSEEPNFWQGSYRWQPEGFATLGDKLLSFKSGVLYGHNRTDSFGEFYGETHKARIMFISNALPSVPKTYHHLVLEASHAPSLTYLYSTDPYEQCTDLVEGDWQQSEGLWQAHLYRNKLVPQPNGTVAQTGLLTGERLRSRTMLVLMEFDAPTMPLQIRFITLRLIPSRGQSAQLKTL
jgi:hypothetical protein